MMRGPEKNITFQSGFPLSMASLFGSGGNMIRLLLVADKKERCLSLLSAFEKKEVITLHTENSGEAALAAVRTVIFDLVLVDENVGDMAGLELVERLVAVNPMINCAAISSLSKEDFHEASEGMGVLCSLPPCPSDQDVEKLLAHLGKVLDLTAAVRQA